MTLPGGRAGRAESRCDFVGRAGRADGARDRVGAEVARAVGRREHLALGADLSVAVHPSVVVVVPLSQTESD